MLRLLPLFLLCANALGSEPLGFTSTPLGTAETPLILRTFVPDPGLDPAVFANHGKAAPSPKYNPGKGTDVKGEYEMLKLIPAAIAVNHGPALSYVFDTTECRVLYAWQGGFLDMYPYWGDQKDGQRRSFDYQSKWTYGSKAENEKDNPVTDLRKIAPDTIEVELDGFAPGRVYQLNIPKLKSDQGEKVQNQLFYYTANEIPGKV